MLSTAEAKEDVINNAAAGQFASVQKVEKAGHLVKIEVRCRLSVFSQHVSDCADSPERTGESNQKCLGFKVDRTFY